MIDIFKKNRLFWIFISLVIFLIFYFVYWHFRLGLTRYFDIDEYAYLHWAYNISLGRRPFVDFFSIIPPFFLYLLSFVFQIFGRSVATLIEARISIFMIFLFTCTVLFLIANKLTNWKVGLLSLLFYSFLPLPGDKMLEIRPDNIAVLFSLIGLYFFILTTEKTSNNNYFFSGFFYSLSLIFLPKTIFLLIPIIFILFYQLISKIKSEGDMITHNSIFSKNTTTIKINLFSFGKGFLWPLILLLLLIFLYGKPLLAINSMTAISANLTTILAKKFYMRPDIFFYPNDTYYGLSGYSAPYLLNLLIYISASVMALVRLISSLSHRDSKKCYRDFLFSFTFFINLYAFVNLFPLKHAQYLLLLAPFISFYFADILGLLIERSLFLRNKLLLFFLIIFIIYVGWAGRDMNNHKIKWTNKVSLDKVNTILQTIVKDEPIFDLTGETVFYPDGYYLCCIPYGQYQEGFPFELPNLEKSLRDKKVKYIHIADEGRLGVIPSYQQKIINTYYVYYGLGLLVTGGKINFEQSESIKNIDLLVTGEYSLEWNKGKFDPAQSRNSLLIDGATIISDSIYLNEGKHRVQSLEKGELVFKIKS